MRIEAINKLKNLKRPVIITGHTGFKGTWLTLLLESQGIEVAGISLDPDRDSLYTRLGRAGKIQESFVDIRQLKAVKNVITDLKPSVVFHLAAQPLVLQSYLDPVGTFATNVMGTANLLESVTELKERCCVVAVTTDKVYQNLETGEKFKETDKLQGKDPYSASKVGAESVITAWKNIWAINGVHKICAARAGNVIGGGDFASDRLIPDIIRGVRDNSVVSIRNPRSSRPWQHVLDPLLGYVYSAAALLSELDLTSINFGPTEKSLPVGRVTKIATEEFFEGLNLSVTEDDPEQPLESGLLDLDSTFARSRLGWEPKWTQEEAIRMTFTWWKNVLEGFDSPETACEKDIAKVLEETKLEPTN